MAKPSLDEIFGSGQSTNTGVKPSLDEIFNNKNTEQNQSKPFYDAIGASMSPAMKEAHPILAGIHQTAQDVTTLGEKFANGVTFGGADYLLKKNNIQPPNFDTTAPENKSALNLAGDISNLKGSMSNPIANAVIDKGVNIGGKLVSKIPSVKNIVADKILNPEFAQTASNAKYDQNARRVLKTMPDIVGQDLNTTRDAIKNKLSETGQAIDNTISNHPNANLPLNANEAVTKPFEDKIAELNIQDPKGNRQIIRKLQNAKDSLINVTDSSGNLVGKTDLSNITPKSLWELRKAKIDPATKFTGIPSKDETILNSAYQDARHNIKSMLNEAVPELKPLNQDYGDLKAASDAVKRLEIKQQNSPLPKINIGDITTLGINRYLSNPVNKIKFSQWLYTAPKVEKEAILNSIPGSMDAIKNTFGETKIPSINVPRGTVEPVNRIIPKSKGIMGKTLGAAAIATGLLATSANANPIEGQTLKGQASTYGWGEHLNPNVFDGSKFDTNKVAVAMRDVPMGTKVEIKDSKTGKTIDAIVNDGGPAKKTKRVVDLTSGAWKKLGYNRPGLTNVEVKILKIGSGKSYPRVIHKKAKS